MKANCPHCESLITRLRISGVVGEAEGGRKWETIVLACPSCNKAISAQIDPIAISTDLMSDMKKAIRQSG